MLRRLEVSSFPFLVMVYHPTGFGDPAWDAHANLSDEDSPVGACALCVKSCGEIHSQSSKL